MDLVQSLRNVSNMINMGEKIRWGEETALMDQGADAIERQRSLIGEMAAVMMNRLDDKDPKVRGLLLRAIEEMPESDFIPE